MSHRFTLDDDKHTPLHFQVSALLDGTTALEACLEDASAIDRLSPDEAAYLAVSSRERIQHKKDSQSQILVLSSA